MQDRDLLTILMGRILLLQEQEKVGNQVELEVQGLAAVALKTIAEQHVDEEVRQAALDVVCYLPARTVGEINFVLRIVNDTNNQALSGACAFSLERARPMDNAAWDALEQGRSAAANEVRKAVEKTLRRRK